MGLLMAQLARDNTISRLMIQGNIAYEFIIFAAPLFSPVFFLMAH